MSADCYRPRLSVDLTLDQHRKIQKYFPHGTIKLVFHCVVDDLLSMIEKYGAGAVLGSFIDRDVKLEEICGYNKKLETLHLRDSILGRIGDSKKD